MKPNINLAIIPARGGSKGIKKKNLSKLGKKTLIEIAVNEILKSKIYDKIVLSSDSDEILDHAKSLGIEYIRRPKKISQDYSLSEDAVLHALKFYSKKFNIKDFGLFQPTSPFRESKHIKAAYESFVKMQNETLISVEKLDKKYLKLMYKIDDEVIPLSKEMPFMPRQKLPKAYLPNGAIYLSQMKYFLDKHSFFSKKMGIFEMSSESSLDIDSLQDLNKAQRMLKNTK
tara:strand:- start:526 stop:1212 length:687 start_codon:yes stop_codon:yes gene_type:complete